MDYWHGVSASHPTVPVRAMDAMADASTAEVAAAEAALSIRRMHGTACTADVNTVTRGTDRSSDGGTSGLGRQLLLDVQRDILRTTTYGECYAAAYLAELARW